MDRLLALRRYSLRLLARLAWLTPLAARITLGVVFARSGWGKLGNLPQVVEFFASLGIPAPHLQAPLAATTELVCGVLLLAGAATRLAAPPLIVTMVVALATALRGQISGVTDLFGLSEFLYVLLLVGLGIGGPGAVSVDAWLVRSAERRAEERRRERVAAGLPQYVAMAAR